MIKLGFKFSYGSMLTLLTFTEDMVWIAIGTNITSITKTIAVTTKHNSNTLATFVGMGQQPQNFVFPSLEE